LASLNEDTVIAAVRFGGKGRGVVRETFFFPAVLSSCAMQAPQSTDPSDALRAQIKQLLVTELNLAGRDPSSIDDEALLFGQDGLGLDSLDALQIAMLVEEKFGIRVPEGDEARPIFKSISSLAEFVSKERDAIVTRAPAK
jgi:acyl carrier protein